MAGFSVNIGADTKQLTAGLTSAKQELNNFNKAIQNTGTALASVKPGANQAGAALTNIGRVAQDLPFGFVGIQNNLNPLLESFQRLKAETGSAGGALKALGGSLIGAGGIGLALSVASSAFLIFQNGIAGFNKKSKEAKESADALADAIKTVAVAEGEGAASVQGNIVQVNALAAVLEDSNKPYAERKRALEELKEINKNYFGDLKLEDAATGALTKTVQEYTKALINSAIQKEFVGDIAKIAKAVADNDAEIGKSRTKLAQAGDAVAVAEDNLTKARSRAITQSVNAQGINSGVVDSQNALTVALKKQADEQKNLNTLNDGSTKLLEQQALITDKLNKAVAEGLKFKDLDSQSTKKEEDALKKRLEALEKIKNLTKDATALVGIQEAIFELQVKIAIRDQKKNHLSKQELDQQIQGFKSELQKAFDQQAIELEAIPKVKFSEVRRAELPGNIDSLIAKATGLDKKIPVITLHEVRIKLLGAKLTADIEFRESIEKQLQDSINEIVKGVKVEAPAAIGEALGEALAGGDIKNVFTGLFKIIATGLQQFGKALIAFGVAQKAFQVATKSLNPTVAIVAGVGLIAAGAALKAALPKFAQGGIVTGPLIGQIGEQHRPEVVMPLDRLPQMLRSIGGGSDSGLQLVPIINNEGLYLAVQRGARRAGRKF